MKKYFKKEIVLPIVILCLIVTAITGISYAVFTATDTGEKSAVLNAGTLILDFADSSSNVISLTEAVPLTDATGMTGTAYTFTLENTGNIVADYELLIEENKELYTTHGDKGRIFPDNKLKLGVTKNGVTSYVLYDRSAIDIGRIDPKEKIEYTVRIWIDYNAGNEVEGNHFHGKFVVNGSQLTDETDESCFEFDDTTGTITKYLCGPTIVNITTSTPTTNTNSINDITDVVIPREINGVEVKSIGDITTNYNDLSRSAFMFTGITSVKIPDSVTSIGNYAFYGNDLSEIKIPSKITSIGVSSFSSNKITSLTLPASLTFIGNNAFLGNQLTNIYIMGKSNVTDFSTFGTNVFGWLEGLDDSDIVWVPNTTDESCFIFDESKATITRYICGPYYVPEDSFGAVVNTRAVNNITDVIVPQKINGIEVKKIDSNAFNGNKINSVVLLPGIETIGYNSFFESGITGTLVLPDSLTSINSSAFNGVSINKVVISGNNLTLNGGIGAGVFSYNYNLSTVVINEGVSVIGEETFYDCPGITKVTIPKSVTSIYDYAFYGAQLTSVTIKGKSSSADFKYYGSDVFSWASGFSDSNITWNG